MYELVTEYSLTEVLDYGVRKGCFSKVQAQILYDEIIMWEDLEGNYYEEDPDKLIALYDAMGMTREVIIRIEEEMDNE